MALPLATQARYWGIAIAILCLILWYLGNVLLPFVIGGAVAYFLDPVADRLETMGCSRVLATVIIACNAVLIFVFLTLLVVPTLVQQAVNLVNTAPELFANFRDMIATNYPQLMDESSVAHQSLVSIGETIQARGGELINSLLNSALSVLNIVLLFVIVPVVAFYLLLDWDNMIARIDSLMPRDHLGTIRQLAREVDATLAGFVRGMGTVCLILGTYYAGALMLVGLQFGLVVGFVAGLVTFIPYLGAIIGGLLAIGLAVFQYWGAIETVVDGVTVYNTDWVRIVAVGVIFMIGQMIEGNFLTPKLVGQSVGLHPVWLLLAMSVFGALFGFIGLLIAVPVAASLGVFARFAVGEYTKGALYLGFEITRDAQDSLAGDDD